MRCTCGHEESDRHHRFHPHECWHSGHDGPCSCPAFAMILGPHATTLARVRNATCHPEPCSGSNKIVGAIRVMGNRPGCVWCEQIVETWKDDTVGARRSIAHTRPIPD